MHLSVVRRTVGLRSSCAFRSLGQLAPYSLHKSRPMASSATEGKTIAVTRRLPGPQQEELLQRAQERGIKVLQNDSEEPVDRKQLDEWAAQGIDGLYCLLTDKIDQELIKKSGSKLKVVSTMSAGFNHIDVEACKSNGTAVGYTPDVLTDTTADLAVALLLSTARRIPEASQAVKNGEWTTWKPEWLTGKDIHGSSVGIIGMGRIGFAIAQRLKGFNCKFLYTGNKPKPEMEQQLGNTSFHESVDSMLPDCDFLVLSCALNDATRGLLGEDAFKRMKSDSIVVNISRGEVIQQDALVEALRNGDIGAAGLDVTTPEPLPADHPLLSLPNALVLPHIGSASVTTRRKIASMALENLFAGIDGKSLPYGVPGAA